MSNMVIYQQPSFTMGDMERMALAIAKGGLFGSSDPNAVLTLCMVAQAEGKHPGLVLQQYHVISGKPAKKADAMLQDFLAAGGKVEWHELSDEIADATFSHPAGGSVRISWDNARVEQAALGKPDKYGNPSMHKKFPRAMKRARVVSEGVRTVFPGATSGMYVPEEVQDMASDTAAPTPVAVRQAKRIEPTAPAIEHQPDNYTLEAARADIAASTTTDELGRVWRSHKMKPHRDALLVEKDDRKALLEDMAAEVGDEFAGADA